MSGRPVPGKAFGYCVSWLQRQGRAVGFERLLIGHRTLTKMYMNLFENVIFIPL